VKKVTLLSFCQLMSIQLKLIIEISINKRQIRKNKKSGHEETVLDNDHVNHIYYKK